MNLEDFLKRELAAAGVDFKRGTAEVAAYMTQRIQHLQGILDRGDVGAAVAVDTERANVWSFAAERAVDVADARDRQAWGLITGILSAAVIAL